MVEEISEYQKCKKSFEEAIKITSTVYERKQRLAYDPNYRASEEAEIEYRKCEETVKRAERLHQEREYPDIYRMAQLAALQHNKSLEEVLSNEDIVKTFVKQMNTAAKCLGRKKGAHSILSGTKQEEEAISDNQQKEAHRGDDQNRYSEDNQKRGDDSRQNTSE